MKQKQRKKIIFSFILAFFLIFNISYGADRTYFGSDINNAFSSSWPFASGMEIPFQDGYNGWGVYSVSSSSVVPTRIGFKFQEWVVNENEEWETTQNYLCPRTDTNSFRGLLFRVDDYPDFYGPAYDLGVVSDGWDIPDNQMFIFDNYSGELQTDGTCQFTLKSKSTGGFLTENTYPIPSGDYVLLLNLINYAGENTECDPTAPENHCPLTIMGNNNVSYDMEFSSLSPYNGIMGQDMYNSNISYRYLAVMDFYLTTSAVVGTTPIQLQCGALDIFCHIKNAFIWAFSTDNINLSRFDEFKTLLNTKPPVGYITGIFNSIDSLESSQTATFQLEEFTPVMDLIFTPIRNALVWILYFAFAFALFMRFRHIQL